MSEKMWCERLDSIICMGHAVYKGDFRVFTVTIFYQEKKKNYSQQIIFEY